MMSKSRKLRTVVCSALLAVSAAILTPGVAKADSVNDATNGVYYNNEASVSVQYCSQYYQGGGGYTYVNLENTGDRIQNVKSSSKNLIAKKTYESYNIYTSKDDNDEKTTTSYGYAYIAYFAKKEGTYKVTFDVVKPDGTVRCTKTIKVKTTGSGYASPLKSLKYDGKDFFNYYPFTTKTSGKLSVKMNKNYKLVKIEIGKRNSKGDWVYKKTANNKKISLAKSEKYSRKYGDTKYTYNELFPGTEIRITYQDKKTKETNFYYASLATINKK